MSVNSTRLSAQNISFHANKQKDHPVEQDDDSILSEPVETVEKAVVNSLAPVRRIVGLPDMVKQGDTIAAAALAGLTLVSLPEDLRDIRDAFVHSKSVIGKKRCSLPYNYKKYQHDFSFFRGTLLHEAMKKVTSERGKKIVEKIYGWDKTLYNTKFGTFIKHHLGIEDGKLVKSKVRNLDGTTMSVRQIILKKDFMGLKDITARAMKRTSLLGVAFMVALELPRFIRSFNKGDDVKEKSKSAATQGAKSCMNVIGFTAGMGYLGALGAKKLGPIGSLVGMGVGILLGAGASSGLQRLIFGKEKSKDIISEKL